MTLIEYFGIGMLVMFMLGFVMGLMIGNQIGNGKTK
jgi:hypothetical protein